MERQGQMLLPFVCKCGSGSEHQILESASISEMNKKQAIIYARCPYFVG